MLVQRIKLKIDEVGEAQHRRRQVCKLSGSFLVLKSSKCAFN